VQAGHGIRGMTRAGRGGAASLVTLSAGTWDSPVATSLEEPPWKPWSRADASGRKAGRGEGLYGLGADFSTEQTGVRIRNGKQTLGAGVKDLVGRWQ
jgi:hypothetical protein